MFLIPAFIAISNAGKTAKRSNTGLNLIAFILILVIGLRMSGGDWNNYFRRFQDMATLTLDQALEIKDVGYQLIGYYAYDWNLGFFAVTLLCAFISIVGLIVFLKRQINPWLGLSVAIPYLVIVVYMGYMRQGVALGLVMWGLVALSRGSFIRFLAFLMLAVTFHKSAIMMVAFGIFSKRRGWMLKLIGIAAAGAGVWSAFVSSGADALWVNYVDAQMQSGGAMIRVLLNAIPAVLLLMFRKEWKKHFDDYTLWFMIALASLAAVGLVSFASTAVDRMVLYFLPLQVIVFSRLPFLARNKVSPKVTTFLIILFYFIVLSVWLNFGAFSKYWLPYRNILFMDI